MGKPEGEGGAISFRFRYRFEGKHTWLNLKSTTLASARKERDACQTLLKTGVDPNLERALEKERQRAAQLAEQAELAKQQAQRGLFNNLHNKHSKAHVLFVRFFFVSLRQALPRLTLLAKQS